MDISTGQGIGARPRIHLTLVHSTPPVPTAVPVLEPVPDAALTTSDMMTLAMWMRRSDLHGYPRTVIEVGRGSNEPEEGGYALVYEPGQDWATFGIARDGDQLVVWNCGSGRDRGRYPTMQSAVDSLPVVWRRAVRPRDAEAADAEFRQPTVVRLA